MTWSIRNDKPAASREIGTQMLLAVRNAFKRVSQPRPKFSTAAVPDDGTRRKVIVSRVWRMGANSISARCNTL